jgi:formylglycine-generating enzyme
MTEPPRLMPSRFPPVWANAWGTDRLSPYPFVEIELAPEVLTRLRWIPPGRFLMGSPESEPGRWKDEGPQHWVTLSKGLWLADAPCTQAEWQAVMGSEPSYSKGKDLPVERVSWDDCQGFCEKLRTRFPGLSARLPTEAEWEYACRAGTTSAFNDGSACTEPDGRDPALLKLGWFGQNSGNEKGEERQTHLVRKLAPNQWGLFDMHGNVWEWCADWEGEYTADDQVDPAGAAEGRGRVSRGGSWSRWAGSCRSAYRGRNEQGGRGWGRGFRLASGQ